MTNQETVVRPALPRQFPLDAHLAVNVHVPCYGRIEPATAFSLLGLLVRSRDYLLDVGHSNFCFLDQARNDAVRQALEAGATHLLQLDSDMVWPEDTLERLLSHGKPVVGGLYFHKGHPFPPVPGDFVGPGQEFRPLADVPRGLRKTDTLGCGALLVGTEVFRAMRQWFGDERWFHSEESGEDVHFFWRLREMGTPAYLDCDLECDHVSAHLVGRRTWESARGARA